MEERSTELNAGAVLSFTDAVLLDCVVDDAFPAASYIDVVDAGTIVSVSPPSAILENDKLKS